MSFSYDPAGTDTRSLVRLLIGDTDSSVAAQSRLEDEEIDRLLDLYGNYRNAAAAAADALGAKFAREVTQKGMGQATLQWDRYNQLRMLAKDLRKAAVMVAAPFVGGISHSQRVTNDSNTDLPYPGFRRGMLDHDSGFPLSNSTTTGVA